MKKSLVIATLALAAAPAFGQTYDNGGMDPRAGGCNSGMYSAIEAPGTIYGNNTLVGAFHQADDFTVPNGQAWTPTSLKWYLYQTASSPTEPIVAVYVQVWRGSQSDMLNGTATLVGGDMTTNRLSGATTFSGIYRTTAAAPTDCNRAIKECTVDMSWVGQLNAGQYWIEIGSDGNPGFSGPWANHKVPRDIANDNSIYFTVGGAWAANVDAGYGAGWDYPFKLNYTGGGGGGYTLTLTGSCPGTVRVAWAGAPANTQQGIVFGLNQGNTTIPSGPCQGTVLGVAGQVQLYNTIGTGNGSGAVNGNAGPGACGHYLQLVAVGNPCKKSNVAQIP